MSITPPPWKAYPPEIVAIIWPFTPGEERQWWIAGDIENAGPGVALVARGLRMDDAILMAASQAMLAALKDAGGLDGGGPKTLWAAADLLLKLGRCMPRWWGECHALAEALSKKGNREVEAIEQATTTFAAREKGREARSRLTFGCPRCGAIDDIWRIDFAESRCHGCGFRGEPGDFLHIVPATDKKGED